MTQMSPTSERELMEQSEQNWKARTYIAGGLVGAAVGLGTAFLLARSSEKQHGGPPSIEAGELLKLSVAVIGVVRSIAALGD